MTTTWMRLDIDFWRDYKVEHLESIRKGNGVYQWLKLICYASECYGHIDLKKTSVRTHVEKILGLKGQRLDSFVDDCVFCELFDMKSWGEKIITSGRLMTEGTKRYNSEQQKAEAGRKSAEKRKQAAEGEKDG